MKWTIQEVPKTSIQIGISPVPSHTNLHHEIATIYAICVDASRTCYTPIVLGGQRALHFPLVSLTKGTIAKSSTITM